MHRLAQNQKKKREKTAQDRLCDGSGLAPLIAISLGAGSKVITPLVPSRSVLALSEFFAIPLPSTDWLDHLFFRVCLHAHVCARKT